MKQSEIIQQIRDNLNDTSSDMYTTAEINRVLNRATRKIYNELLKLGLCFNKTETTIAIATDSLTDLPATFQKLLQATINGTKVLILGEQRAIVAENGAVFVRNNKLGYNMGTAVSVKIVYAPTVTSWVLNNDNQEVTDIPPAHHDVIADWATVLLVGKDEDNAMYWQGIYANDFATMVEMAESQDSTDQGTTDVYNFDYEV